MVEEKKIPEGYRKSEIGIIPDKWECVDLGETVEYIKGYAFKSKEYTKSGARIIRVSDTTFNSIKDENAVYINSDDSYKYSNWKLKEDDIIISTVGSKPPMYDSLVGKAIRINEKYAGSLLNQNAVLFRSKSKNQKLIYANLRTDKYIKHIEKIFRGNANQASITLNELFEFKFAVPKDPIEQKAIATALSDIDDLISSLEKLINKKKLIKQGAKQELLTGKKRLDGFSGDWEFRCIGDLAEINTGSKNTEDKVDDGKYPFFVRSQKMEKINTFAYDEEAILTAGDGVGVGKVFHYINGKFNVHQRVYKISNFKGVYPKFFFEYFKENFYNEVMKYTAKSSVDSVRRDMIDKMLIPVPNVEEQKQISQILSDMDEEIKKIEIKLDKYNNIKRGMMEELLTGKRRLV